MEEFKNSQKDINEVINHYIDCKSKSNLVSKHELSNDTFRNMLAYAVKGGKRLRPMIAYEISKFILLNRRKKDDSYLNQNNVVSIPKEIKDEENLLKSIILFVEFLHCASLILDDMPCMDNDELRRGMPTFHTKYGVKSSFIIAKYMISNVTGDLMRHVVVNKLIARDLINVIIREMYDNNLLTSIGQIVDLHNLQQQKINFVTRIKAKMLSNIFFRECIKKFCHKNYLNFVSTFNSLVLINMKTFPLFYLSFLLPYLSFANVDEPRQTMIYKIEHLSICFSIIFQMSDDFEDWEKDKKSNKVDSHIKILDKDMLLELYDICKNEFLENTSKIFSFNDKPPKLFMYFVEILNKKIKLYGNGKNT